MCFLLANTWVMPAYAQTGDNWTDPILLSAGIIDETGLTPRVSYPILATDARGGVHAIWSATFDARATIGDVLYYSYWDGSHWSAPVDVVYMPDAPIWIPKLAVDGRDWLHAFWTENVSGPIMHTLAVSHADSARLWSQPVEVVAGRNSGVSLVTDAQGDLHLVYCSTEGLIGVYHVSLQDGLHWSLPHFVGELGKTSSDSVECRLGIAVDDQGRLHVAWGQALPQGTPIYYSRSSDSGLSWSPAMELDRKDERYFEGYGPGRPNLITVGKDEVHVIWFGAPAGQRWHSWSSDGGDTWSTPEQISAQLRGFMEPPALAADSAGVLHVITRGWLTLDSGDTRTGTYHITWRGGRWSAPSLIENSDQPLRTPRPEGSRGGGEYGALVITGGNTLHAVWEVGLQEIWASQITVEAPFIAPAVQAIASVTPSQSNTPASDAEATEEPAFLATRYSDLPATDVAEDRSAQEEAPALIALLSAGTVVFLAVLLYLFRHRRA